MVYIYVYMWFLRRIMQYWCSVVVDVISALVECDERAGLCSPVVAIGPRVGKWQ